MTQARHIKKKAKKKSPKQRKSVSFPWGLMFVILACSGLLLFMFFGAQNNDSEFGAGIKQLLKPSQPVAQADTAIASLIENKSVDKTFTFYWMLKDDERYMPDDLPEAAPTRAPDNLDYYLQAASFRDEADAEKLRARLALQGYKSITQARTVENNGLFYRVRLGPYADKRKAKTAKNKLQRLGVRPYIFTVKR